MHGGKKKQKINICARVSGLTPTTYYGAIWRLKFAHQHHHPALQLLANHSLPRFLPLGLFPSSCQLRVRGGSFPPCLRVLSSHLCLLFECLSTVGPSCGRCGGQGSLGGVETRGVDANTIPTSERQPCISALENTSNLREGQIKSIVTGDSLVDVMVRRGSCGKGGLLRSPSAFSYSIL